jgi:hypothetical protein
MSRSGLEGFGRSLSKEDEVVVEATGNAMAVVRVLSPYVARVIVANPLQVNAIAHAHVNTVISTQACWRRCGQRASYRRSGCPARKEPYRGAYRKSGFVNREPPVACCHRGST